MFTDQVEQTFEDNITPELNSSATNNTHCASCGKKFRRVRRRGLDRYTLTSLKLQNTAVAINGNYVCGKCRNIYRRKPLTLTETDSLEDQHRRNNTIAVHLCYDATTDAPITQPSDNIMQEHSYFQSVPSMQEFRIDAITTDHNYSSSNSPSSVHDEGTLTSQESGGGKRKSADHLTSLPEKRTRLTQQKANGHGNRTAFKATVIDLIQRSKYERALHVMYGSPNRAVKSAIRFLGQTIRKEVKSIIRNTKKKYTFSQKFGNENLMNFKWRQAIDEVEEDMPVGVTAIANLFPEEQMVSRRTVVEKRGLKK